MKYLVEESLANFDFWSGAKQTADELTYKDFEEIEGILECSNTGDYMTDTEINDFFWFEDDTIAEWLGYEDWEDLIESRKEE